jgi:hypothetical protein
MVFFASPAHTDRDGLSVFALRILRSPDSLILTCQLARLVYPPGG